MPKAVKSRLKAVMSGTELPFALEVEIAVQERRPGEVIRFVLDHEGACVPLFWLRVGKDGSFYFGRRLAAGEVPRRLSKPMQGNRVSVRYSEGLEFDPKDHPYVSVHSAGVINVGPDRFYRTPFAALSDQEELCRVLFEDPTKYPHASPRKRDVSLSFPIDHMRPLSASIFIAPADKATPVLLQPSAESQTSVLLSFSGLTSAPDLVAQFVFWHGPTGPWPKSTYFIFLHRGSSAAGG